MDELGGVIDICRGVGVESGYKEGCGGGLGCKGGMWGGGG